jgi:hypothetical protein
MPEDKKLNTHSPIFFVQRKGFTDVGSFCLLSFMLPTTSEISWTRSGLAYFIVLRKRSNAHAYEHVRAAMKWNQAQYTWPNRRFQWKYFIVNTWRPTDLSRDCGQWLRNLNLRNGSSRSLLIGPQDFKYWKLQLSSFVRRRNPQLWYLFLESAARKIVACLPPSLLPSRLARLKQTSCPILYSGDRACLYNSTEFYLTHNSFYICLFISFHYMFRAPCAHHQESQSYLYNIWYIYHSV